MNKIFKGLIVFMFIFNFTNASYTPSKSDLASLDASKIEIIKLYKSNPNKAYDVEKNIDKFYKAYINNTKATFLLQFIDTTTKDYIAGYEAQLKIEADKKTEEQKKAEQIKKDEEKAKEESTMYPDFNNIIIAQNNKLKILTEKENTKIINTFSIEPKNDNIYLKNIYLENIGSVGDMTNLFEGLYLVDDSNRIISSGYIQGKYLVFDINSDYSLQQDKLKSFNVKANIKPANNENQVGELKFNLSTPSGAQIGTLNGVRANSYSNGAYVNIETKPSSNVITTLITYNNTYIESKNVFKPTYNEVLEFRLYNNSKNQLKVNSFELYVSGSFLTGLDPNTRFVAKVKGTNQIFGSGLLQNMAGSKLMITYGGGTSPDYISAYTYTDYTIEIEHVGNPKGKREIKLENVVVGDGFGGIIGNLNSFNNTGVPTNFSVYDY